MSKKTVAISLLFITSFLVISRVSYWLFGRVAISEELQTYCAKIFFGVLISIYSIFYIKKARLQFLSGISKPSYKFLLLYCIPWYIVILLDISNLSKLSFGQIILPFMAVLFHAFAEELTIRGIILPSLITSEKELSVRSLQKAIVLSAVIFGIVHFASLLNYDFTSAMTQVVYATIFGLFYGVVLVKGRNIYFLSLSHAVVNFLNRIKHINQPEIVESSTEQQSVFLTIALTIVLFLPILLIAIYLIRKLTNTDVLEIGKLRT